MRVRAEIRQTARGRPFRPPGDAGRGSLEAPQLAIGTLNKMIEEQEHEVQIREAELKRDRAIHGRFAKLIGAFRGAPARVSKVLGNIFAWPPRGVSQGLPSNTL